MRFVLPASVLLGLAWNVVPDHLGLIAVFLLHGTVFYGIVLIPLCFLSRHMLWALHERTGG